MIVHSYIYVMGRHFGTFLEAMISTRESDLQEVHRKTRISRPATNSHIEGKTKPTVRIIINEAMRLKGKK